jgi:hypothetical protein
VPEARFDPPRTYKSGESFSFTSTWVDEAPSFGDIIRQGRIWSPPPGPPSRPRPFSVAVVGLTWPEAERIGKSLPGYDEGELFFVTPDFDPVKYLWFRFDKAYVVIELLPEFRTEAEDKWFAEFERQLNPGAKIEYID